MNTDVIIYQIDGHWLVWAAVDYNCLVMYGKVTLIDGEYVCGNPRCVNPDHVAIKRGDPTVRIWATILTDRHRKVQTV